MRGKWIAAGLLAGLACALPARAGDSLRLKQTVDAPVQRLVDNGQDADTVPVWWRGGYGYGFRGGFYRPWGGFYRGVGRVATLPARAAFGPRWGWGGSYYGGFYRGVGFYRPWGGLGYGLGGYGLGLGYGLGGYGLSGYGLGYPLGGYYYSGYPYGLWGCSGVVAPTVSLGVDTTAVETITTPAYPYSSQFAPGNPAPVTTPGTVVPSTPAPTMPQVGPNEDSYPYDGGPADAVPMPPAKVMPRQQLSGPGGERAVSLPKPARKLTYPAYGEQPRPRSSSRDKTLLTQGR